MESDGMNDPMLKAAIEASLRGSQIPDATGESSSCTRDNVVDLTADSDDDSEVKEIYPKSASVIGSETEDDAEEDGDEDEDDEDLERALALSMQGIGQDHDLSEVQNPSAADNAAQIAPSATPSTAQNAPELSGLLGLDRKQMEQERLARLAKRKAGGDNSPPLPEPKSKVPKTEISAPPDRSSDTFSSRSALSPPGICRSTASNSPDCSTQPSARPFPQWPLGAVKKTHVLNAPRKGNEITIEEVFQRADLELAVLSSFMWDMEWLFSKLDTQRTRILLMMQAKEEATKRQFEEETSDMPNLRLCFPPMDGQVNCMHSKLMLLFHADYVRIVVPTANLTMTDWGENRLMENSVFLIDLPKNPEGDSAAPKTAFYEELVYFLKFSTLHENIIAKLDSFDFSNTARYAFVHTIGGSHAHQSWKRTGYCGLGRAVASLGLQSFNPINIDFVTSSIGSLTDEFLRAIYLACQGDDGLAEYTLRNSKSLRNPHPSDPTRTITANTGQEWRDRFHVYFPSERTVRRAHRDPTQTAGTICFQSKWWQGKKFPRHVLRDCEGEREFVLMHNKLMYVSPSQPIVLPDNSICRGWVYVGSANLSESAWGRLVKDRATSQPKLNCRNWECGVVVPVTSSPEDSPPNQKEKQQERGDAAFLSTEIFRDTVPVPMRVPAAELNEGREPWFFTG